MTMTVRRPLPASIAAAPPAAPLVFALHKPGLSKEPT